jgi:hypothetical protein
MKRDAEKSGCQAAPRGMHLDLDGLTGFRGPRPLGEARPFPTNAEGRLVAMVGDGEAAPQKRKQPFLFEEPRPPGREHG